MNEPRYLNVDLVVSSKEELTPIVESFGKDVVALFNGEWAEHYRAVFEIAGSHAAANEDIGYFCSLIEGLEGKALELWQSAYSREFDVGFESGSQGERAYVSVQSAVVKRVAEAGASISITLYPGSS
jgi:hypothetical protein